MAEIIASLSLNSTLELFERNTPEIIDPTAPIAADLPQVARTVTGKRGVIGGVIMDEPKWVETGAKELCYNNGNSDNAKSASFSWPMCDFESYAELCPADLEKAICGNESQGTLVDLVYNNNLLDIGRGKPLNIALLAQLQLHTKRLRKDGILQRTFGAKTWNVATSTTAGFRHNLNNKLTTDYINNFIKGNLGKCDSLWGSLHASYAGSGTNKVKYVDSNGSAAATKFLNPQYTTDYADSLINSLDLTLRDPSKVIFFIDPALYDSLHIAIGKKFQYIAAYEKYVTDGSVTIDVLMYRGYNFVKFSASEVFDQEADAIVTTNVPERGLVSHSANLRGMALSTGNIMVGIEVMEQELRGAGVVVKKLNEKRERGTFTVESLIRRGLGIVEPKLCTISYASNATFA
jgi:hypothetical protein